MPAWMLANLLERDPARVFFCEFYEIFKNTYFGEHLLTIPSGFVRIEFF